MGGSGGRRGDVERWSLLHDDLAGRLAVVRAGSAGRPVVLYGHSLGGLIVAGYLLTDRPAPDLAVLSSPALDDDAARVEEAHRPGSLGRIAPTLAVPNGIDGATLSRDPAVAAKTARRPAVRRGLDDAVRGRGRRRAGARAGARVGRLRDPGARPAWGGRPPRARLGLRAASTAPRCRAADLPGSPPRAPQRARGARRSSMRSSPGFVERRSARPMDAPIRCYEGGSRFRHPSAESPAAR